MQTKLDRRAAIGLMAVAAGIIASDTVIIGAPTADQPLPKVRALVDMDRFEGFTVKFKDKEQYFSTEDVMDALFGAGKFGN